MAKKQNGNDLDNVKGNRGDDKPKITDLIDLFSFKENSGKYVTMRLHGGIFSYATYWVQTKKKDGGFTQFPVPSPSYDPTTGDFDPNIYDPWLALARKEKADDVDIKKRKIRISIDHYANAIFRAEQKKEPAKRPTLSKAEKTSGFKDKDSDSWTPNKAVRFTQSTVDLIKKRSQLNTVESKSTGQTKAYSVFHPKFGADIQIQYDSEASSPSKAYDIVLGKRRALTEEEQAELIWDLSDLQAGEMTEDQVRADFEGWAKRNGVETSKGKKGSKRAEEFDDNFEEDDEDEPKSKAKKGSKAAPAKGKKKPVDDEDDDFESDDGEDGDDDEDEDDTPKSKAKSKAPAKGKKPVSDDEDDSDDGDDDSDSDDDEDDEDEDDEPPKKSKAPAKKVAAKGKSKKAEPEDDEDDDEDSEDEDEDDEPPAKSKKAPAKKTAAKKKPADDEDDDFDSDDDEDDDSDDDEDDEDDEPPAKKKVAAKKAPAKKVAAKGKKKPADDEDDDDFEDDDE